MSASGSRCQTEVTNERASFKKKNHYLGCLTRVRPGNVWLVGATRMKAALCGLISSLMLLKRVYDDVLCHRPQAYAASPLYYKML